LRNGEYFLCGDWEGTIDESEIIFIEKINKPKGY
jgi:hypothetical protein